MGVRASSRTWIKPPMPTQTSRSLPMPLTCASADGDTPGNVMLSLIHILGAVGDAERLVGVLLDEENGGAVGIDFFDDGKNLLDDDRREACLLYTSGFPLTASGKIQKYKLREMAAAYFPEAMRERNGFPSRGRRGTA